MENEEPRDISKELEESSSEADEESYNLRLYVAGRTPKSAKAIANIKRICDKELKDRYNLEIVDVYQEPDRIKKEQLIALPTLIKRLPAPIRRIIGDLSDEEHVLVELDLKSKR